MKKFNVYVKRKSALSKGPEFTNVEEFLLLGLISVLCSQDDVEYFTISEVDK